MIREGETEDVFIPEEQTCGAFQGDEVEFIITRQKESASFGGGERRMEGKIVKILSHTTTRIVGLYEKSKRFGFVRPDDQRVLKDIYIPEGKEKGAVSGHKSGGRADFLRRTGHEAGGESGGDHRAHQ